MKYNVDFRCVYAGVLEEWLKTKSQPILGAKFNSLRWFNGLFAVFSFDITHSPSDHLAMSLPADYHMHTPLCRHAAGEPADYARHAVDLGLTEIGFSDHSPMRRDDFDNWRMRFSTNSMNTSPKSALAQKDFPQLTIRLALEVDYLPGHEDWIRELAARHPWDYFIGSVHYVSDSWDIDNPAKLSEWKNRDAFEVWSAYFDRLTLAAESGLFEIIGHADLPKKFGHRPRAGLHAALREVSGRRQARPVAPSN